MNGIIPLLIIVTSFAATSAFSNEPPSTRFGEIGLRKYLSPQIEPNIGLDDFAGTEPRLYTLSDRGYPLTVEFDTGIPFTNNPPVVDAVTAIGDGFSEDRVTEIWAFDSNHPEHSGLYGEMIRGSRGSYVLQLVLLARSSSIAGVVAKFSIPAAVMASSIKTFEARKTWAQKNYRRLQATTPID